MKDKVAEWIGSSKRDLIAMPSEVRRVIGYALRIAQKGGQYDHTKPLKGFHGTDVIEILVDDKGNAYRGVYTIQFPKVLFILHVFQKKSKRGIETPKRDIDLIKARLKQAEALYNENYLGRK